ncbi:hypothetical protein FQN53_006710 [Emmonsiellopsis sp. PD_33]|nr:hypothetical protein FQN53_006710 [Emmonsiellopsis sp. PD_33]
MELQAPSVLAQLPRPLGASAGKCQLGEVYGVEGSKKRKRYEVAAAIDGESVNIYSIQFPKLVTSYAIPPQSSFSCPPCSVRQKSSRKTALARRQTYCAIEKPEKEIKCFLDESGTNSQAALNISNASFKLADSDSPVVYLGVIPANSATGEQEDPFDVLVVHKDGRIRRLSPDLKSQKWNTQANIEIDASAKHEIQASFVVGFEDARKSLFRKRQDIIATVLGDELGADSSAPSILVLVSRPSQAGTVVPGDIKVNIFSLPTRASADDIAMGQGKKLRHLMTVSLPGLEGQNKPLPAETIQWNFHPTSSGLSLSFEAGFIHYDISQYSPEISSHMILANERFSSLMRISPLSVIGVGKSSIAVYNTRYQSVQADLAVSDVPVVGATKSDADNQPITFVSYFSKLGIAIATRGTTLLGFDLAASHDRHDTASKRSRDGLLINAIGKGIPSVENSGHTTIGQRDVAAMRPVGLSVAAEAEQWAKLKLELDALVTANDHTKFDDLVRSEFNKSSREEDSKIKGLPSSKEFVDPEKISYLLSKIFSLETSQTDPKAPKLVISFMPKSTFQWLINSRHLSLNNIQTALRRSMLPRIMPPIPSGSLIQALVGSRGSVKVLTQVLRGSVDLDPTELTHALKIILDIARSHPATSDEDLPKAITQSSHPTKDSEVEMALETPSKPSSGRSDTHLTDAITALNLALKNLHTHPLPKVTQSIRSVLSNSHTLSIIHHLRHSLATGGYTSRFLEAPEAPLANKKFPTLSLATMVDLLTACIDAIGPSGWISAAAFANAEDSEACLVADMKSEISAALAGIEEATYLKGILREFIRYAETATAPTATTTAANTDMVTSTSTTTAPTPHGHRLKRREYQNGAEILIYDDDANHTAEGGLHSDTQMLPLSLKRVAASQESATTAMVGVEGGEEVSETKVRKTTGEVLQRSKREVGYLKSKGVGKYSFERIVI